MKNLLRYGALGAALTLSLGLTACGTEESGGQGAEDGVSGEAPSELTLALVPSSDSQKLIDDARPLTDALSESLGVPVKGVVSTDYAAAVEAIGADQAQIGLLAPLPMIQAAEKYDAEIVLQSVRFGSSTYHSQFFTNKPKKYCTISTAAPAGEDGFLYCNGTKPLPNKGPVALETLGKVKGAKVALQDPSSTSGYIFPMLALKNAGVETEDIEAVQAGGHDAAVIAVYDGDAEVGVSFDDARSLVAPDRKDVGQRVVAFAYSAEIPNDGVVVSGDLSQEWQDKITKALMDYAATEEGQKTLYGIYEIEGFAPAVPESLQLVSEAADKLGLNG